MPHSSVDFPGKCLVTFKLAQILTKSALQPEDFQLRQFSALAPLVASEMAVDEVTVLLHEAIAEFQASRRQAETLVRRIRTTCGPNFQLTQRV